MSQRDPNQEERERMVNDVIKNKMTKEFLPPAPTEVDEMMNKLTEAINAVKSLAHPKMQHFTDWGMIHTKDGRNEMMLYVHKLFLDHFKQFNADERLFLLAFIHARLYIEANV